MGTLLAEKYCYRPKGSRSILITFDDYGSPEQINYLIDLLAEHQVRAMFFIQGDWAEREPAALAALKKAGHIIGNHTYSHPDLTTLTRTELTEQITKGPNTPPWFRPPYGRYTPVIRRHLHERGYVVCYWTIDSHDWAEDATPTSVATRVLRGLHPGAVVLFHAHQAATLKVLPELLPAIRAEGYELYGPDDPDWTAQP
jgi:peptidoglycan-N-acetylglucosamine deacetylase